MGHNRSGAIAKARMRRRRKEGLRLAAKDEAKAKEAGSKPAESVPTQAGKPGDTAT